MRSKYRDSGRRQSFAVMSPSLKSSSCCSTGSGARVANTSPGNSNSGSRLTWATAAAVARFVAPGPMEVVHAIMRRRYDALAKATAAWPIACSLWARSVGRTSRAAYSASPSAATLPCPNMAQTPANTRRRSPSTSVHCAAMARTRACATVSRLAVNWRSFPADRTPGGEPTHDRTHRRDRQCASELLHHRTIVPRECYAAHHASAAARSRVVG